MAALVWAPWGAHAQSALGASGQGVSSPESVTAGDVPLDAVSLELLGSTGSTERDQSLRADAWSAIGLQAGDALSAAELWLAVQRLEALPDVASARCTTRPSPLALALHCVVQVRTPQAQAATPTWPKLHESPQGMLKVILNGGVGAYSEGRAFFGHWAAFNRGSPIAPGPDTGSRVTFLDGFVEPGLGGITKLAPDVYGYGAVTVLASGTWGQDIYRREDRMDVAVEKACAGLLWAPRKGTSAQASFGRQNYTLNDGFLIHHVKGSTNVGERRALFLGARTAHDRTALFSARSGSLGLKLFYLDPNEYEPLETNSTFAGGNLRYDAGNGLTLDATYIENRQSDSSFATPQGTPVPRRGIATTAAHLRWKGALGIEPLFLESELGHQRSSRADVSANAGYATVGYRFDAGSRKSAIVARLAQWSGDKPETRRYERWDPILPAGSDEWMGGIVFSKFVVNSNLRQLRLRYFAEVTQAFNVTLDWFRYRALETNNLGGARLLSNLRSRDLGQELMFTGRWFVNSNLYVQTVTSINAPGEAVRQAVSGGTKPWTSLQASLYWFY